MHSLAMAQEILATALIKAEEHGAKQINVISVKIPEEHFDKADSLQFCLETVTKGTIAEKARIEIINPEALVNSETPQVTLELE